MCGEVTEDRSSMRQLLECAAAAALSTQDARTCSAPAFFPPSPPSESARAPAHYKNASAFQNLQAAQVALSSLRLCVSAFNPYSTAL